MKLKAIGPVSLRSGDKWLHWKDGEVFDPPSHMNVDRAIKRGIVERAVSRKSGRKAVESDTEEESIG